MADRCQADEIARSNAGDGALDRYLSANPLTELDREPAIHSCAWTVAQLPENQRYFPVRKDIDHRRLVHPDDQYLPQDVVEGGFASRIFEVGNDDRVLGAKRKHVALVQG